MLLRHPDRRAEHIANQPPTPEQERKIDYGRPLMALGSIEETCDVTARFIQNALKTNKWYLPVKL